ncbi:MAG TPA: sulfotransferase [Pseudonocardiaceae bacterium]
MDSTTSRSDVPGAFVMNPGRCGSTLLSTTLAEHPQVLSLQEYMISLGSLGFMSETLLTGAQFWQRVSGPSSIENLLRRLDRIPREIVYTGAISASGNGRTAMPRILGVALAAVDPDPDRLFGELAATVPGFPRQDLGQHHRQLFALLAHRYSNRLWVERSGGNCAYLGRLLALFPDAKVVYLSRNCVDTVLSMRRHPYFQLATIGEQFERRYGFNPFDEDCPDYDDGIAPTLRPLLPQHLTAGQLDQRGSLLEPFVLRWVQQDLYARAVTAALPDDQLLELDYDELVADPADQLTRVGRFLDLDDAAGWAYSVAYQVVRQPHRVTPCSTAEITSWQQKITKAILTTGTYQPSTVD